MDVWTDGGAGVPDKQHPTLAGTPFFHLSRGPGTWIIAKRRTGEMWQSGRNSSEPGDSDIRSLHHRGLPGLYSSISFVQYILTFHIYELVLLGPLRLKTRRAPIGRVRDSRRLREQLTQRRSKIKHAISCECVSIYMCACGSFSKLLDHFITLFMRFVLDIYALCFRYT